jgi:hypothetical protein
MARGHFIITVNLGFLREPGNEVSISVARFNRRGDEVWPVLTVGKL